MLPQLSLLPATDRDVPAPADVARELAWATLAPLIAARPSMRLIDPDTNTTVSTRRLTRRPPAFPAAVPVYDAAHRTRLLALDFDSKRHGAVQVAQDVAYAKAWLRACGAVPVSDLNPANRGRHVLVSFAPGETHSRDEIEPVMRLLGSRLPTLDIGLMLNPRTGAITPPGSATRDGAVRELDGTVDEAAAALRQGAEPGLLARLREYLGVGPDHTTPEQRSAAPVELSADLWEGAGSSARLRAPWCWRSPIPSPVEVFATSGVMPADGRWPSRSEARASVLAVCAKRGWSLDDVRARRDDTWQGLAGAYAHYRRPDEALAADWERICTRWITASALVRSPEHRLRTLTPPEGAYSSKSASLHSDTHSRWLATAHAWVHQNWPGQQHRWTVLAVLDALAYAALVAGKTGRDGTPLVAVGVRALAGFAGLLSVGTVADVLADLRERPGSPILRIRRAVHRDADCYSLVTAYSGPELDQAVAPVPADRVQLRPVHDAWKVLGLHHRAVYQLIVDTGLTNVADVLAAAGVGRSTGYDTLAVLAQAGLITRGRGIVSPGEITLDDIAAAHGLHEVRTDFLARIQRQRAEWHAWLELRHQIPADHDSGAEPTVQLAPWDLDSGLDEAIWAAQMAAGPPE
ncbi:hypothetical protein [Nocardia gipuzkoensis]|uniref:hypothetical protein n=1 Tax=Nocardia gipuzkoensis TaxID=2749991 RepID=UPI00237DD912|nr:hypothetical protein [Nocardia gipuzkoensis]MDE1674350.1 hypothetical protein [Nocardia gipuzkoensis]